MIKKLSKGKALLFIMIASVLALAACNRNTGVKIETPAENPAPSRQPDEITQAPQGQDSDKAVKLTVKDYYPMLADVEYVYSGEGNEFASYSRFTDFLSDDGSRIQTRTSNGGTETVRVVEAKDGKLSVIKIINECYYRDNLIAVEADEQAEILLMEPLVKGTKWTLADGRVRYISGTDVEISTESGKYLTLEVTTEDGGSITKDYYAPGVGPVKTVFNSNGNEVTSELSQIKQNAVYVRRIDIFYPGIDENIYVQPVTISFKTGDITRLLLMEAISKKVQKEDCLPLASTKTRINSMYLGSDNIAYIDFSEELITEMSVGSGYEAMILQCIANTVGNYYGTDRVYLTVEGKPYESGHIIMYEGETIQVDMSRVKE